MEQQNEDGPIEDVKEWWEGRFRRRANRKSRRKANQSRRKSNKQTNFYGKNPRCKGGTACESEDNANNSLA